MNSDFINLVSAPDVYIENSRKSGLARSFVRTMYEYTLTVQHRVDGEKFEDDQSEQRHNRIVERFLKFVRFPWC